MLGIMTAPEHTALVSKLSEAALSLASQSPWDHLTLSDLCFASEVTLADCAKHSVNKAHICAHLDGLVDQAMLSAQTKVDRDQSVRDRLFDVLMGRFDAMEDNRAAWSSILTADKNDMVSGLARRARRARSGAWALEASGVSASDARGAGRSVALARLLRLTEAVWMNDGPDLAKTMAHLDKELRAREEWVERAQKLRSFFGGAKPAAAPTL